MELHINRRQKRRIMQFQTYEWRFFKRPRHSFSIPKPRAKKDLIATDIPSQLDVSEDKLCELPTIIGNITLDMERVWKIPNDTPTEQVIARDHNQYKQKGRLKARHKSINCEQLKEKVEMPSLPSLAEYRSRVGNRYIKLLQKPTEKVPELPIAKTKFEASNSPIQRLIDAPKIKHQQIPHQPCISKKVDLELNRIKKILHDLA